MWTLKHPQEGKTTCHQTVRKLSLKRHCCCSKFPHVNLANILICFTFLNTAAEIINYKTVTNHSWRNLITGKYDFADSILEENKQLITYIQFRWDSRLPRGDVCHAWMGISAVGAPLEHRRAGLCVFSTLKGPSSGGEGVASPLTNALFLLPNHHLEIRPEIKLCNSLIMSKKNLYYTSTTRNYITMVDILKDIMFYHCLPFRAWLLMF